MGRRKKGPALKLNPAQHRELLGMWARYEAGEITRADIGRHFSISGPAATNYASRPVADEKES